MLKISFALIYGLLFFFGIHFFDSSTKQNNSSAIVKIDTLRNAGFWPGELQVKNFTSGDLTPSPACLAVAATGEVYVGVDKIGSLGKTPKKRIYLKTYRQRP